MPAGKLEDVAFALLLIHILGNGLVDSCCNSVAIQCNIKVEIPHQKFHFSIH